MSYFPKRHSAVEIVDLLRKDADGPWNNFPQYRKNVLREALTAIVCPVVCVGHVNETGWHALCEQKVNEAMVALGLAVSS